MKKNRRLIILVILLGSLSTWMILRNNRSTFRSELRDFAVKDTAAITQIFLADRNGHEIRFTRTPAGWTLNDSLQPRMDNLQFLLEAIYRIDIKSRVPKAGFNNVVKNLAATGVKCEIYLHHENKPFKVYYVGGETQDALGTFMMLENSSVPFVMEIPGFNGYLTPRYSVIADNWKVPVIFSYEPDSIRSISVNYPGFPVHSFILEHDGRKNKVYNPATGIQLPRVDSVAVDNYLTLYRGMYYEGNEDRMTPAERDSLLQTNPLAEITVTDTRGKQKSIGLFPMPINEGSLVLSDSLGQPLKYDVDRMIGYVPERGQWVIIQHFTFDRLLREVADFDPERKQTRARTR